MLRVVAYLLSASAGKTYNVIQVLHWNAFKTQFCWSDSSDSYHNMSMKFTFLVKYCLSVRSVLAVTFLWTKNAHSRICSIHFREQDFSQNAQILKKLKPDEVPSVFPNFPRIVDRVFDFSNSRSPFSEGYKAPINIRNLEFFKKESEKWIQYFLQIRTMKGNFLYESPRRTFIISFITSVKFILSVADLSRAHDIISWERFGWINP